MGMAQVVPQRSGTNTLANFFNKVNTDGDAIRILGAETGFQEVQSVDFTDGVAEVTLGFNSLVGVKQLRVSQRVAIGATSFWAPVLPEDLALSGSTYYTEDSGNTVTIYGPTTTTQFLFDVPHTSIPAELREKIVVRDQGNNDAIELLGNGDGILLRSGSGFKYLVRVDDSGSLVTEPR